MTLASVCRRQAASSSRHRVAEALLRRACRLSSEFATATKRHEIARLLEAYRGAVNLYVGSLWEDSGALDKETPARMPPERTRLPSMQKDRALRQALAIVSSRHRSAKALGAEPRRPGLTGMAVLCHGVTIEPGRGSFDLVVRLSTLHHHSHPQDPRAQQVAGTAGRTPCPGLFVVGEGHRRVGRISRAANP